MDNNFRVTWDPPDTGLYDGYIVRYTPDNGQVESGIELPKDETSLLFPGLTPNTPYNVMVHTFVGYNGNKEISAPAQVTETTGENSLYYFKFAGMSTLYLSGCYNKTCS